MKTCILGFLILLTGNTILLAQNKQQDNLLQQQLTKKIVFAAQALTTGKEPAQDLINAFELKEGKALYAQIFLQQPLMQYLQMLNPSLTEEELAKKGNFQFSFYVDGKLLYTENLNTGAGTLQSKSKWTNFRIPLISATNEDNWGRFLWSRFYFGQGGEDALFGAEHQLKIEIRPYLKENNGIQTGAVIASGQLLFSIPVVKLSPQQIAIQPIAKNSGWKLSKAPLNKKLIQELNERIYQKRFKEISSIVVIKNGQLLLEEYFNGAGRDSLHNTRSVGKSFASTLMGVAIKDGYIANENQILKQFYNLKTFANFSAQKENVTLKGLLTMSSGFDGSDANSDSPGNEENMYPTANWVKFALDLPMDNNKLMGKDWDYFTAGVVLLGDILNQKVPQGLENYAEKKLFGPLGIKNYQWQYTPQQVANTAGGLGLRTLDLAKYGQLYQNKGSWQGKQLLPANWVAKSFTNYFSANKEMLGYGYLFWREVFELNGKTYEAFACSGNGGNKVYIFQNLPLVIVITAKAYNRPYAHPQVYKMMKEYLLPAVLKP